jgi:hypothetical protein
MFSFFYSYKEKKENNHDRVTKERKQDVKMTKKYMEKTTSSIEHHEETTRKVVL